jgi:undecaprenyl pyrophosphate synthase
MNIVSPPASQDIGANNPPVEANALRDRLIEDNDDLIRRKEELLAGAARVPDVTDDEMAGKVSDFIKQLTGFVKVADNKRVAEKEPFLSAGRTVDGFFKALSDPVEAAKKAVERKLTGYLQEKANRERREREEAARIAREEAERQAAEARRKAEAMKADADLAAALEAEQAAQQRAAEAAKAEKSAAANAADLSRTRGDYGAVGSLRTTWDFRNLDRDALDLESLRQHLPLDALEKAVRSAIKAGVRELRGVEIYEAQHAVVR